MCQFLKIICWVFHKIFLIKRDINKCFIIVIMIIIIIIIIIIMIVIMIIINNHNNKYHRRSVLYINIL